MVPKTVINLLLGVLALLFIPSCNKEHYTLEPSIEFTTPLPVFSLPSAFPDLTQEELSQDWGKELLIANQFAKENDLYRAITSYKRALILIPRLPQYLYRQQQIEYDIILSYYLGNKYQAAIEAFENSNLTTISSHFLAFDNLLRILYDIYIKSGQQAKAVRVYSLIQKTSPETAQKAALTEDILKANLSAFSPLLKNDTSSSLFLDTYHTHKKSVTKAKVLNSFLPGAGYYYLGQKNTALTAFFVNSLFTAAAYYFFDHGNWAAGMITTSLEMGWYFGGIHGAGLAAKEFNEHLYGNLAKEYMIKNRLFPILNFQTSF